MAGTMTVSEVREIYPRPEGAAVQKRWRKLYRFMSALIKRSPSYASAPRTPPVPRLKDPG
jgi:hypothetical protein